MATKISQVQSHIGFQANQQNPAAFSTTYRGALNRNYVNQFTGITFANEYFATRTATAAVDAVNLNAGLTDGFNQALSFLTLRYILVHNNDATHSLNIFGGSNPVIAGQLTLPAGMTVAFECNYAVNSTTALNINVDPGANTVAYDIIALGT